MKITKTEWKVLRSALTRVAQEDPKGRTQVIERNTIATNLISRFTEELSFPKGRKP